MSEPELYHLITSPLKGSGRFAADEIAIAIEVGDDGWLDLAIYKRPDVRSSAAFGQRLTRWSESLARSASRIVPSRTVRNQTPD